VLGDLEIVGGGSEVPPEHPDLAAVLARNPQVVCIDDLAAVAGSGGSLREELDRLLDAGITVIATVHVADALDQTVLELADDIELVDVPSSTLVERVLAGDLVEPADAEAALRDEFSEENLASLREEAFRMVAWHADHQQVQHLRRRGVTAQWEFRPRVMACVAPRPGMERLIRRAAGLAASLDTDFRSVTVRSGDPVSDAAALLERYSALTLRLGGQVVGIDGHDVAPTLAQHARDNLVTELLAVRRQHRGKGGSSTLRELIRTLNDVDVHILPIE
jgi:two-component system sensor histidine kinase KdpD